MSFFDALQEAGLIDIPADSPRPVPHFGDPQQEFRAARESAVFIVEHGFGMLTVTGEDRVKFLQNFCTNDITKLKNWDVCEAFFCNVKGRILALGVIICQPNLFLILTDESRIEFLRQHLDRYIITEDVTLEGADDLELLLVLSRDGGIQYKGIGVYSWKLGDQPADWLFGIDSMLVSAVKEYLETGAVIAGHDVWEYLRISAGYPRYGVDISDENLAQEANRTAQAIAFTKGCYLGQEPIARLDAMGHVNRQLERLSYEADAPLPVGSSVRSATGDQFGTITSSGLIPGTSRGVALAMLKVKAAQADELVAVAEDGTKTAVELFQSSDGSTSP